MLKLSWYDVYISASNPKALITAGSLKNFGGKLILHQLILKKFDFVHIGELISKIGQIKA